MKAQEGAWPMNRKPLDTAGITTGQPGYDPLAHISLDF